MLSGRGDERGTRPVRMFRFAQSVRRQLTQQTATVRSISSLSSLVVGETQPPLLIDSLGQFYSKFAAKYGDKELLYVRHEHARLSWRELDYRARKVASGLARLGYEPGDRIGVWMPNNTAWVVTQWAAAYAGLILVNFNPAYRPHELQQAINLSETKGLIIVPEFKGTQFMESIRSLLPPDAVSSSGDISAIGFALKHVFCVGEGERALFRRFDDLQSSDEDRAVLEQRIAGYTHG